MKFWILWGCDAIVSAVVLYFFFAGLADGSVSSFNFGIWALILAVLAAIMLGSVLLRKAGQIVPAVLTLLILAIPSLLGLLFCLLIVILNPRWN